MWTQAIMKRGLILSNQFNFSIYKYPYNINRQEHKDYLRKVESAQKAILQNQTKSPIPRRKRRVYDRPKHDLDISQYAAWRIYDPQEMLFKFWAHGSPIAAKLQLQPKWVIHAFGMGLPPANHYLSASFQFSFEDNNFSKFLLYQYRNTTLWRANQPGYNYQQQDHVPPKQRKIFRHTPEQFWKSQEYFEFRLNCTDYAQRLKFKKWIQKTIEESKTKPSYDQFIDKKYTHVLTFNNKNDMTHFKPSTPAILNITPQHYNFPKKNEKPKQPKVQLAKKQDQKHRVKEKQISEEKQAQANN